MLVLVVVDKLIGQLIVFTNWLSFFVFFLFLSIFFRSKMSNQKEKNLVQFSHFSNGQSLIAEIVFIFNKVYLLIKIYFIRLVFFGSKFDFFFLSFTLGFFCFVWFTTFVYVIWLADQFFFRYSGSILFSTNVEFIQAQSCVSTHTLTPSWSTDDDSMERGVFKLINQFSIQ